MERLWAPWRMTYVGRAQSDPEPGPCIFCVAAGDEAAELVVHRTARTISLLNRFPYNPGHLMVAPLLHGGALEELENEDISAIAEELQLATAVLRRELRCEGLNGGWNQGRAAGAGIDQHLHFHLVPRWNGDTNFMPVLADVKVLPEHLSATAEKLRAAFRAAPRS